MTGRRILAAVAATLALALAGQPAAAQAVMPLGWNPNLPNGSKLSDPANGTLKCTNNAGTAACSIIGTATNDNAAAGGVGEYICAQVTNGGTPTGCATNSSTPVGLTTGTAANVASVSLTAGDWTVCGEVDTIPAGSTTQTATYGWISTTTAAYPGSPNGGAVGFSTGTATGGIGLIVPVGCMRQSLASTTTVYLEMLSNFAVSTNAGYGFIWARRGR